MKKNVLKSLLLCIVLSICLCSAASADKEAPPFQPHQFKGEVKRHVTAGYLLYLPKGYNTDKTPKWPLILFLHGAGERGSNLEKAAVHGPLREVREGREMPFIIIAPLCPMDSDWDVEMLNVLLDDTIKRYRVDKDRVYLTGLSMGGHGVWNLAARYPDKFAAIIPICGWGPAYLAHKLKNVPVWAFHGEKDKVVPFERTEKLVNLLKKNGGKVKFTPYPKAGHDSWTKTYDNPRIYKWLLKHKKGKTEPDKK